MASPLLVGKTYCIKPFGCQMNLHDSERVSGLLDACGCNEVSSFEEADIAVFMTCCVRENADQRLYGQASTLVSMVAPPSGKRVVFDRITDGRDAHWFSRRGILSILGILSK